MSAAQDELVGQRVQYRRHPGAKSEPCVVIEVRGVLVMVLFDGDAGPKAVHMRNLELPAELVS